MNNQDEIYAGYAGSGLKLEPIILPVQVLNLNPRYVYVSFPVSVVESNV